MLDRNRWLKIAPWLLLLLFFLGTGVYFRGHEEQPVFAHFALHLGLEAAGVWFTIYLIERFIKSGKDEERARLRRLALSTLATTLGRLLRVFAQMYKASLRAPCGGPTTAQDLFVANYFPTVQRLDVCAMTAPPVGFGLGGRPASWADYLAHHVNDLTAELNTVVQKYSAYLSDEDLHVIEGLRQDDMLRVIKDLDGVAVKWPRGILPFAEGLMEPLTQKLRRLLFLCETDGGVGTIAIDESIWNEGAQPTYGSGLH